MVMQRGIRKITPSKVSAWRAPIGIAADGKSVLVSILSGGNFPAGAGLLRPGHGRRLRKIYRPGSIGAGLRPTRASGSQQNASIWRPRVLAPTPRRIVFRKLPRTLDIAGAGLSRASYCQVALALPAVLKVAIFCSCALGAVPRCCGNILSAS